jgi:putative ATP-dependent endonuclease of OLD family
MRAYDIKGQQVYGFNNEDRASLAFAYVDASRSFDRQFGVSRWTLFGQAVRFLHDDLLRSGNDRLPDLRAILNQAHGLLKTDLYNSFEIALRDAFSEQLRTSRYDVQFQFRTIDETNLYRSLYPTLVERGKYKSPGEAGSGVRNLLVLALFHAFARAFRGSAILGIEEPELFLHPHAQRSLKSQFKELAAEGNQIFISSHSSAFLDITRPERVVLVECREDDEGDYCTNVRTTTIDSLLERRQNLHPERPITPSSLRAFMRNIRTAEMAEPYFSKLVIVAEGPSEREALPLLCSQLGLDFDVEGISIIAAGGKTAIDTLVHVYQSHEIPVYVIFDNDDGNPKERNANKVMCRLLSIPETESPVAAINSNYAILNVNWETQMRSDLEVMQQGLYDRLAGAAQQALGIEPNRNKPLVARFIAESLAKTNMTPGFISQIVKNVRALLGLATTAENEADQNSRAY